MGFEDLGLTAYTLRALSNLKINEPTEVQKAVIPPIIAGTDVAVRSPTGSGKTLAFVLGLITRISQSYRDRYALIFSPTRELAIQTRDVINRLQLGGMTARAIYGDMSNADILALGDMSIKFTVATPRKLWDLTQKKRFYPERYNLVVLDEADELLLNGFKSDIDYVLARISILQTLFFSATLDKSFRNLSASYQKDPMIFEIGEKEVVRTISTEIINVANDTAKLLILLKILREEPGQVIVFVFSRVRATRLGEKLAQLGINATFTHKEVLQVRREEIMNDFRSGKLKVLVGTDILARGIDIPRLPLVVEYDQPFGSDSSIHRAGRTGRMGNIGRVISFNDLTGRDPASLRRLSDGSSRRKKRFSGSSATNTHVGMPSHVLKNR
ncbi:MAG: DEAD/DEAH box helicase [Candidatus Micrarchaeota archaeon]|nr:DEAD/DEAH box helicase [Candidatus Micrarchaeota archaeon]